MFVVGHVPLQLGIAIWTDFPILGFGIEYVFRQYVFSINLQRSTVYQFLTRATMKKDDKDTYRP